MSYRDQPRSTGDQVPLVGRPRGAAWRALQADGVVWEGQVILVGGESDLASRMIVTHRRVAFARGGAIALEVARDWLRPAPILRRDGTILLSITPPGASYGTEPETIALRMRDGHPAAGHVIAMLAGSGARRITPDAVPSSDYVRGYLPPLPEARSSSRLPRSDIEEILPELPLVPTRLDDELPFGSLALPAPRPVLPPLPGPARGEVLGERDPVVRPAAPPVSMTRDRSWNLEPARQMTSRSTRQRRKAWVLRLGGLVVLLGFSALLGADRIPLPNIELPSAEFPLAEMPTPTAETIARYLPPTAVAGVESTVIAESPSFALGIGSEGQPAPDRPGEAPGSAAPPAAQATAEPTATAAPPPTEVAPAEPTAAPAVASATAPPPAAADAATAEPATTAPPEQATDTVASPIQPTIERASRGATIPEFGLTAPAEGEWVVVMVTLTNDGADEAELAMTDFMLEAAGAMTEIDSRSTVVASILRLQGVPDEIDGTISLDPGESITLPLVFRVPVDATDLALRFGESRTDLAPFLTTATSTLRQSLGYTAERAAIIAARLRTVGDE